LRQNPLRSILTGKTGNYEVSRRYRHDTDRKCDSHHKSVKADVLEAHFLRLLESLTVNPETLPLLAQALEHFNRKNQPEDKYSAIQAEIAHWRQRARNADTLYARARITEEEWRELISAAEHTIARLQAQIAQHHETEMALKLTTDMVTNLIDNWNRAGTEMRRALAGSVFSYLVFDLDTQRITDFKLKPWAELLLQLKVTLDEGGDEKNEPSDPDGNQRVLPRAWRASDTPEYPHALLDPQTCAEILLRRLYQDSPTPPPIDRDARDEAIYQAFLAGESTAELATRFGMSVQHIRRIIRRWGGAR